MRQFAFRFGFCHQTVDFCGQLVHFLIFPSTSIALQSHRVEFVWLCQKTIHHRERRRRKTYKSNNNFIPSLTRILERCVIQENNYSALQILKFGFKNQFSAHVYRQNYELHKSCRSSRRPWFPIIIKILWWWQIWGFAYSGSIIIWFINLMFKIMTLECFFPPNVLGNN